jgi:hypothetical protein
MWWIGSSDWITLSRAVRLPLSLLLCVIITTRRPLSHFRTSGPIRLAMTSSVYQTHLWSCSSFVTPGTSALHADIRYIRNGGKYKLLGTLALLAPMAGAFVASFWTPNWSTWSYYATVMPMTFGYSVFLCCQLGMFPIASEDSC